MDGRTDAVRDACAFSLGKLGDPCARELLKDAKLNAPNPKTRAISARALEELADAGVCKPDKR